jgi:Fe-S oxidoreductase
MEKLVGLDRRRHLPAFASKTLQRRYQEWRLALGQNIRAGNVPAPSLGKAVLFADVYTNHLSPEWGMSTLEVFNRVGMDMELTDTIPEGRASLSQGMIATATRRAENTAAMLEKYIDSGLDVIVIEPSVLALFRADYRHLLSDARLFRKLREHTFEPVEYLENLFAEEDLDLREFFDLDAIQKKRPGLFYHSHCQQRSSDTAHPTVNILKALGFDLKTSEVECCGMAGSFGFKKDYYDVSMRVGEELFGQIEAANAEKPREVLLASGTSCHDQIHAGTGKDVIHPMEILAEYLK